MNTFPKIFKNLALMVTMLVSAILFASYQLILAFILKAPGPFAFNTVLSVLTGLVTGAVVFGFYRLLGKGQNRDNLADDLSSFSLGFFITTVLWLVILTVTMFFTKQNENLEWTVYEFSAIGIPLFLALTGHVLSKKRFASTILDKSLAALLLFSLFYSLYISLFNRHEPVFSPYYLMLFLIVIPAIEAVRLKKLEWLKILPGSLSFHRGKKLALILLFNIAGMIGVTAFHTAVIDKAATVFILSLLVSAFVLFRKSPIVTRPVKTDPRLAAVLAALSFILIFIFIQRPIDFGESLYSHYNYYLGPAMDVIHGKSLLYDTPSQYGYLSIHFLSFVMRYIGASFGSLHYLNLILFAVYFLALILCFARLTDKKRIWIIGATLIVGFQSIYSQLSGYLFPSTGFMRFGLGILVGCEVLLFNKKAGFWIGSILSAVSLFWSIETALYVVPAWMAYCAVLSWQENKKWPDIIKSTFTKILVFTVIAASLLLAIFLMEYRPQSGFPVFSGFWEFALAYKQGFGTLPVSQFGNHYLIILVMMFSTAVFIHFFIKGKKLALMPAAAFFWVFCASVFSYFISRSHENNIINIAAIYLIEIALMMRLALDGKLFDRDMARRFFVLPAVVFCFFFYARCADNFRTTVDLVKNSLPVNIADLSANDRNTPYLVKLSSRYRFDVSNVVLLSETDFYFLAEADIRNGLPFFPREMTMILPKAMDKYIVPAIKRMKVGTAIIADDKYPEVMKTIRGSYDLRTLAVIDRNEIVGNLPEKIRKLVTSDRHIIYSISAKKQ